MESSEEAKLPLSQLIDIQKEEKFYNKLDEADYLVDYFCIVGLDQVKLQQIAAMGLQRQELLGELRQMKPYLISRFPPKNKKSFKLDEGVEASFPEVRNDWCDAI